MTKRCAKTALDRDIDEDKYESYASRFTDLNVKRRKI